MRSCDECGSEFYAKRLNRRYCDLCRKARRRRTAREYQRRVRLSVGHDSRLGQHVPCGECGVDILVDSPARKYCESCASIRKKEYRVGYYLSSRREELARRGGGSFNVPVTAKVTADVSVELRKFCKRHGLSQSEVLRLGIEELLGRMRE